MLSGKQSCGSGDSPRESPITRRESLDSWQRLTFRGRKNVQAQSRVASLEKRVDSCVKFIERTQGNTTRAEPRIQGAEQDILFEESIGEKVQELELWRPSYLLSAAQTAGAPGHSSGGPHRRNPTGGRVDEKRNSGAAQARTFSVRSGWRKTEQRQTPFRGPTFKFLGEVRLVHCTRIDSFFGVQRQIPKRGAPRMRFRTSEIRVELDSMEHMQKRPDCEPQTHPDSESHRD